MRAQLCAHARVNYSGRLEEAGEKKSKFESTTLGENEPICRKEVGRRSVRISW